MTLKNTAFWDVMYGTLVEI